MVCRSRDPILRSRSCSHCRNLMLHPTSFSRCSGAPVMMAGAVPLLACTAREVNSTATAAGVTTSGAMEMMVGAATAGVLIGETAGAVPTTEVTGRVMSWAVNSAALVAGAATPGEETAVLACQAKLPATVGVVTGAGVFSAALATAGEYNLLARNTNLLRQY